MEKCFILIFILTVTYIVLGNYLYFNKVLPGLKRLDKDYDSSLMPSGQIKQTKEYIIAIENNNNKPWFYYYLKYNKYILVLIAFIFLLFVFALFTGL